MSEPTSTKRPRTDAAASQKLVGTHSGTFHADEALAVNLVRSLEEYEGASEFA
jgi:hypothetical protein